MHPPTRSTGGSTKKGSIIRLTVTHSKSSHPVMPGKMSNKVRYAPKGLGPLAEAGEREQQRSSRGSLDLPNSERLTEQSGEIVEKGKVA
eukprot:760515-Hanusia_phi.AAC.2